MTRLFGPPRRVSVSSPPMDKALSFRDLESSNAAEVALCTTVPRRTFHASNYGEQALSGAVHNERLFDRSAASNHLFRLPKTQCYRLDVDAVRSPWQRPRLTTVGFTLVKLPSNMPCLRYSLPASDLSSLYQSVDE